MHITKVTDAQRHAGDCRKKINSKPVNNAFTGNEAEWSPYFTQKTKKIKQKCNKPPQKSAVKAAKTPIF